MKKETLQAIEQLQNKVKELQSELNESIYSICESMDYRNSSRFSYNIDRLDAFVKGLNEFELLPEAPNEEQTAEAQVY